MKQISCIKEKSIIKLFEDISKMKNFTPTLMKPASLFIQGRNYARLLENEMLKEIQMDLIRLSQMQAHSCINETYICYLSIFKGRS